MARAHMASQATVPEEDDELKFTPPAAFPLTPPSKMAKPTVKPINSYAVSVSWVPPADFAAQRGASSRPNSSHGLSQKLVHGFRLRYRTLNVEDDKLSNLVDVADIWPPDAYQACLKWLKGGLTYIFQVQAFNDAGDGDWSDSGEPFLMPKVASSPNSTSRGLEDVEEIRPLGLSAQSDSIEISWKRPCDRGARIICYDLICSEDPNFTEGTYKELKIHGDECRAVVRNLEPNTTYFFKYRAKNEVGSSAWSPTTPGIATKARPPEAPDPPSQLESSESGGRATEVAIRWYPPASFGIPIQHYSVRTSTHPDMKDAVEILVGDRGAGAIAGQEIMDGTAASESAPSSPAQRRPGFNRGQYALTQLRVKGLSPMTKYYFQVKAQNQIGESAWSRPSAPTLTAASPPARCGQARHLGGEQRKGCFRICWSQPDSYGLPITKFDVRFSRMVMMNDGVQFFQDVQAKQCKAPGAGADDMEATLGGNWAPGVEHFCQVRAWNDAGSGSWSTVSQPMKVAPERPAMPEAPSRFRSLPRAVVVYWEPQICLTSPVTGYRLRYDTTREMRSPVEVIGLKGTKTEFAVTGLAPHHSYHFQLSCVNLVGCSEWSPASRPVQVLQLPPVKMSSPFLVNQTQTSITVGFTPPVDCGTHDGQLIQSYTVQYAESLARLVGDDGQPVAPGAGVTLMRDARPEGVTGSNLRPGRTYYFQVFAVNEFGEGEPSEVAEFFTNPAPPDPPCAPAVVEYTAWSLVVAIEPHDHDSGSSITHYMLQVLEAGGLRSWIIEPFEAYLIDDEDKQHFCINGLKPGTTYQVQCAAINGFGQSPWSTFSQACTTKPTSPGKISDTQVLEVKSTTFRFMWTAPVDNGCPITEYTITRSNSGRFDVTAGVTEVRCFTTDVTVQDCAPGTTIWVRVSAHNALGEGEPSNATEVTMEIGPPFPVPPPLVRDVTSHSVRLVWAVPYDGGDPIQRFWVAWMETDTDGTPTMERDRGEMMVSGLKRQCNVLHLQALREYIFKVGAENSVGVGPYGGVTEPYRLKPPEPPGPPGQPVFISSTLTMLVCHWSGAEPNGAPISEQVVRVCKDPGMPEDKCIEIILEPYGPRRFKPKGKSPNKNRMLKNPAYTREGSVLMDSPQSPSGCKDSDGNFLSVISSPYGSVGKVELPGLTRAESTDAGWSVGIDPTMSPQMSECESTAVSPSSSPRKAGWSSRTSTANLTSTFGRSDQGLMQAMYLKRARGTEYEFDLPGLKGGQDYYVAVAARNKVGLGQFSPVSEMMSTLKGPPLGMVLLIFHKRTNQTLTLKWDVPDCQGAPILHYEIRCAAVDIEEAREAAEEEKGVVPDLTATMQRSKVQKDVNVHEYTLLPEDIVMDILNPEQPTYCMHGLLPGVCYSAMVRSTNELGTSPWSTVEYPLSTHAMVPAKMQAPEPQVSERTQDSIVFRWNLPDPRGSPLIAIELRHMAASIEECTTDSLDVAEQGTSVVFEPDRLTGELPTKHTISGFLPGTMVALVSRAINAVGPAEWSDRPGLIGREKKRLPKSDSSHAIIEGDNRVMERDLLRKRPKSAPYGSAKKEDEDDGQNRIRALDFFLKFTTAPTIPTDPEVPTWDFDLMTPFTGVFKFKVGKMNGLVYSEFGFRLFAGQPGEDFDKLENPLGEEGQEPVREYTTPVSYEENSSILSKEYLRTRWVLDLQPGTVYAAQAYTANELGRSGWSPVGPPCRTPPDRPVMTRAMLSEFTSPSHIQLRWGPPYHNGLPIQSYDIRWNAESEYLPLRKWNKILRADLEKGWKVHEADETAKVYEVRGLEGGIPHWFIFRARNAIGYSDWSEVGRFVTKPSRPAKIQLPVCAEAKPQELLVQWEEPDYHGAPITRYECVASMKKTLVAWGRITGEMLWNTNDLDRLFGTAKFTEQLADELGNYSVGQEALGELDCDEALYMFQAPTKEICHCQITGLLPGVNYYFMVRGVSDSGKGNWSNITRPMRTDNLYPAKPKQMQVESTATTSGVFSFLLPYNNGTPITGARLVARRCAGPVADHEVHPETGEVHDHIASQQKEFDPFVLNSVRVDGLLPGSEYEVTWACINSCGLGFWSDPTVFKTVAGLPDVPGEMFLPGM